MNRFTNISPECSIKNQTLEALSLELIQECKSTNTHIKKEIRKLLESLSREIRKRIVSFTKDGCACLFICCKRGIVEAVEYLITVCDADIEQRGLYEVPEDRSIHFVTPLWAASVAGKLPVVKCLVRLGASINTLSDTGSSPVRSACFMSHIEIVKFLTENGADIRKANQNGGTCLINSVQSTELCSYLISKGIDVNAKDIQHKTALHYAIQEHRLETVQLLLEHGADPFAKSRYGDDALQTSCLKAAHHIFEYLKSKIDYTPERLAEAHELIGSTFLDEYNELTCCKLHWRLAYHLRVSRMSGNRIEKLPKVPLRQAYLNQEEFTTLEELDSLDVDGMRIQSLLICERILGLDHRDTLFKLMFRGASYADSLQFQRCLDLWLLVLQVRVNKFTILYSDSCFTAQSIVRLFLDLLDRNLEMVPQELVETLPRFEDVLFMLQVLANDMETSKKLLQIQPVYRKQQENFDKHLKVVSHLIYLLLQTARTEEHHTVTKEIVLRIVQSNIRSSTSDTLLHLVVSQLNVIKSAYFSDSSNFSAVFPNANVVKLLLSCGANANAHNRYKSTPLHCASLAYNYDQSIVEALLEYGAHIDAPNRPKEEKPVTPLSLLKTNPGNQIKLLQYQTLACLCCQVICKFRIPYKNHAVPSTLEKFIQLHES